MRVGVTLTWQNLDWDRYEADDFSRPPDVPDVDVYRDNRALGDLVEPLGFDSLFAVEHHMTPHHMTGRGLGILTYFAGRTERIDLGTCLIVLPWHHPVQVAEDICFLDNLVDGRRKLWLGFGRGSSPREFEGLGMDMSQARDRFAEGTEIVRRALCEDVFSFHGQFYRLPHTTVRPRPVSSDLTSRMYAGVSSPSSLPIAAGLGYKLMLVGARPWEDAAKDIATFNELRAAGGLAPMHPILVAPTVCASSDEAAWEQAERWIGGYLRTSVLHYQTDRPERFRGVSGYETYAGDSHIAASSLTRRVGLDAAALSFARNALWGTPHTCIERLRWAAEHMHVDHVVLVANPGGMPRAEAEASLRLFAKEVLPAAGEIVPAAFPAAAAASGQ
jgi:alkanesulfonate monooxygenase SsuD/methylene tetrahydromethanopterin reductase-like flavin-dependent oxidoreductase (luciferase family)